jgi:hypothetical protein
MLLSNIIPGFSLAEAKDSIMEYEQFKTAMEVCCCVVILYCVEMLRPVQTTLCNIVRPETLFNVLLGLQHCSISCWTFIVQCVIMLDLYDNNANSYVTRTTGINLHGNDVDRRKFARQCWRCWLWCCTMLDEHRFSSNVWILIKKFFVQHRATPNQANWHVACNKVGRCWTNVFHPSHKIT